MTLCIVVADGARPETLWRAIDAGELPALARVRAQGSAHTITTVFPSVTGSAYTPFLVGMHPGRAGLPGLRWYDRSRFNTLWPAHARSYVGIGGMRADKDLTPEARTLFEVEPRSLGGFTYIGRGLRGRRRIGTGTGFAARMAWTHFRADVDSWLRFDRWLGEEFARRVRAQRPRVAFLAHPGVDKLSHRFGQDDPRVLQALKTVDATVARLQADAGADGRGGELEIWVVSDHGHEDVANHEDLERTVSDAGWSVKAHPNVLKGRDVGVMVSGNCMAHIYVALDEEHNRGWEHFEARFGSLLGLLLHRPAVDLALVPRVDLSCDVLSRTHGRARVSIEFTSPEAFATLGPCALPNPHHPEARLTYEPLDGDPLQLGGPVRAVDPTTAWQLTRESAYPDSLVQILALANAPRSGDIILSAAHGWDLRARWEPSLHYSGHGALRRDQMLVPLLMSRRVDATPRRTTEIYASALEALGLASPRDVVLDGGSFLSRAGGTQLARS
ncbi:MAG: alkaline phosphatase family protein [Gemmatimonadaceae bacterium]|nr:alkaline phosphatase family protein [Gemmatimonadaceae bacterium]